MRNGWMAAGAMALAVAVAGCDAGGQYTDDAVDVEMIAPPGSEMAAMAPTDVPADRSQNVEIVSPPERATVTATAPRVAYVYRYGLELPVDRAPGLMARHEKACVAAGVAVCQVIGAESTRFGQDELSARLAIRATPAYVARFRNALSGEAEAEGGRVASSATESEDLTRALVDTEARLRAQTTLRDRLQQLLATRSGPLEQLLQVERELARVQGEIDAEQSNLALMRTRVATSRLEIDYRAAGQLAPDSAFLPVRDAVDGATGAFMVSVAAMIWVAAILAPIALVAVPLAWFVLRRRRDAKAKRRAKVETPGSS